MKTEIEITNPEKVIFEDEKIRKIDIVNYYNDVAPLILKHIDRRLLSVIRCHKAGENFFKKHPSNDADFVNVFKVDGEEYFYISTTAQLLAQVQFGSVEFHTWGSSVPKIAKPNLMIFDLDPDENLSLDSLRDGVLHLKKVLDELNLSSFLKTSGGKGYHICVPFKYSKSWDEFSEFSRQIALVLENKLPKLFTTNIRKAERNGKIFVDFLRNKKGATCAAPYSLRLKPNAPVSMPIEWNRLDKVAPNQVTIKNYKNYLKSAEKIIF